MDSHSLINLVWSIVAVLTVEAVGMNDSLATEGHLKPIAAAPQQRCRVSNAVYLHVEKFRLRTCASCYQHLPKSLFEDGKNLVQRDTWLVDLKTGERFEPSIRNTSDAILKTFSTPRIKDLWVKCCHAAVECCRLMRDTPVLDTGDPHCDRTWDGWGCWPDTPNGTLAEIPCPAHVYFFGKEPDCQHYAVKECLPNATWFRLTTGSEFSNYSCSSTDDFKTNLNSHVVTFSISIVLLVPSLVVFFCYRQLRVVRIFMHKNLFVSLLLTSICVVIFESYIISDSIDNASDTILQANHAGCKVFYVVTKYFRLSTYTWMFCEGFYLHKLIANAFSEQKNVYLFLAIGWGFPIIPVGIWAVLRKVLADDGCWLVPARNLEWVMFAPMLMTLIVNLCFLGHIIKVIVTKLKTSHVHEPAQFRRAVRATVVLIPLFGLHFLFLIYHPNKGGCHFMKIYNIIVHCIDGLQGSVVALIFCYFNNEVIYLLRRSYRRRKTIREAGSQVDRSRATRGSRTSVSTNVDSIVREGSLEKAKGTIK